jgi:hypothetical protein
LKVPGLDPAPSPSSKQGQPIAVVSVDYSNFLYPRLFPRIRPKKLKPLFFNSILKESDLLKTNREKATPDRDLEAANNELEYDQSPES